MRLIARFELVAKTECELYAFLSEAFKELAKSEPFTHKCRNALVRIENIREEIDARGLGLGG